jgi:L-iditol 2-dehydrogenase
MKVSVVTAPGETRVVAVPTPTVGPTDVLVKIRACGICDTDGFFISLGGSHVIVVDLIAARLDKALKVGADAVINSTDEDVVKRIIGLHGSGESMFTGKAGTDIYFDAAGAPAVIETALAAAKSGAKLGVVAVHKQPVPVDFLNLMSNEITIVGSMGYPDEIFEVTEDLTANWEEYAVIISHTIPFDNVDEALRMASTPGAADKVVVTFN